MQNFEKEMMQIFDIVMNYYKNIDSKKANTYALDALKSSGLKLKYYGRALLNELESFDYCRQNPTITLTLGGSNNETSNYNPNVF